MAFRRLAIGLVGLVAIGCSGRSDDQWTEDRPATVPAKGVLTYKGQGVEGATVILAPESTGPEAYGASAATGSGGEFSLATFPPDEGAVPGRYRVGVTKFEAPQTAEPAASHEEAATVAPPKALLPEKYADPAKSGLTIEIPEGGKTDIKIELQ